MPLDPLGYGQYESQPGRTESTWEWATILWHIRVQILALSGTANARAPGEHQEGKI